MKILSIIIFSLVICSSLTPAFAAKKLSFDEAAVSATTLKGCQKKMIDKVTSAAVMLDPSPGTKGYFLSVCDEVCTSSKLIGPLAAKPTEQQLASLKGQRMCVSAD